MRRFLHPLVWLCLTLVLHLAPSSVSSAEKLEPLAHVRPWPVADNLVIYRNRLWFSVSVKGRNHNSADLWSIGLIDRDLRYERHLFSQDAGRPLVFHDLLYWPHEDPRLSLGYGVVSVTNGEQWTDQFIKSAEIFHVHDLVNWSGSLVAVTSAWRAGLQISDDSGSSWSEYYDHPTPERRVSRLHYPAIQLAWLFLRLRDPQGTRLVRVDQEELITIDHWPRRDFRSLVAHGRSIFGIVGRGKTARIWQTSQRQSFPLPPLPDIGVPVSLRSHNGKLWLLTATDDGGRVAASTSGDSWTVAAEFDGGRPYSLLVHGNAVFVAGASRDGRGIVWAKREFEPDTTPLRKPRELPRPLVAEPLDGIDWPDISARLEEALANPGNYLNHGRGGLRDHVRNVLALSPAPEFLSSHLNAAMPDVDVAVIGGESRIPARHLGQWILLWAMGSNADAQVPAGFLNRPWTLPELESQKYFDPLLAALYALARTGQNSPDIITALIDRLDNRTDPDWLKGDIVGTLAAVTGKRFAYDFESWKSWWKTAQRGSNR